MRLSLGLKLGFWLALLGALSTALAGYYVYERSREQLLAAAQEKLLTTTQVLAQRFGGSVQSVSRDVYFLASLELVRRMAQQPHAAAAPRAELADVFAGLLATHREYSQVRLIGVAEHGRELVRIDRLDDDAAAYQVAQGSALQEKAHFPYFFETLRLPAGKIHVSPITLNQEQGTHHGFGKPTIRIAAPVYASGGAALGIVVIDVDMADLFDNLRADLPPDLQVLLANRYGDYLIHPDASRTFGFNLGRRFLIQDDLPVLRDALEERHSQLVFEIADEQLFGAPSLAAFLRVPFGAEGEHRFVLLGLFTPLEKVLAQSNALGWTVIQLTLLFVALATLVALLLARLLAKPIDHMAQIVRDYGQGKQLSGLPVKRDDELGELARSFSGMAQQLNDKMRETQQAEAKLHAILDHAPVGIWMVDVNGRYQFVNHTFCSAVGIPEQRFLETTHLPDLMGEEDAAKCLKSDRECLAQEGVHVSHEVLRFTDGEMHELEVTKSKLRDAAGQVVGLIGIGVDVTERKRMEMREQIRTQVLEQLADGAPLPQVLQTIALGAEGQLPDMRCAILLLDAAYEHLQVGSAPHLPAQFSAAMEGLSVREIGCTSAAAVFNGQRVVVADIAQDEVWSPRMRELAAHAGIVASWAEPIRTSEGWVVGVVTFYPGQAHAPNTAHLQIIAHAAYLAGIAIGKKRAESQLKLAASVFTHAREGIIIADAQGRIVDVNETFSEITGYSREEVIGTDCAFLSSGEHDAAFFDVRRRELGFHGHWSGEVWNRRRNGELYVEMQTVSLVRDAQGAAQNIVTLFSDITQMKRHEQQLEHIAHYDVLTGLPNRVLKAERLQRAIVHCQRHGEALAVAYLDLDGFKEVNDRYGHGVGDRLLIALARRMRDAMREEDTLARIGGDEFVAILVGLGQQDDYIFVLERLLAAASAQVDVDGLQLQVSASIGVTLYPQDGADSDMLLRHADQAMYQAKQAGKNRYHLFDVAHDMAVQNQHETIERVRHGLGQGEFMLYYQPKVNMRSGQVIGAEALIRWQHPERGLLPPAAFLPQVEGHAVGIQLGEWVIDNALRQMKRWQADGVHLPVSVNVAANQFQQEDFEIRLGSLLAAHPEVSPQQLELEVLESSALEDVEQVSQRMLRCRAMGVTFSLDDFGTGYSSLTYLKRLPADVLKIDQSFVREMLENDNDLAIIEGIVGLSNAFRRKVIAEGVETAEHGVRLLQVGCELAQGYGIARPMPAHDIPHWVAEWRPYQSWS